MNRFLCTFLVLLSFPAAGQRFTDFSLVDSKAQTIDAPNVDSLARALTQHYATEREKFRSIFTWVASNISYNTAIFNRRTSRYVPSGEPDTTTVWKSADEMVAEQVFARRVAVCDGYAKLFKTLCIYAGLKCELVIGYANGYVGGADRFKTNHTWNAVQVDGEWRLIDATWGSGYVAAGNEFVHKLDDFYFFTPPHLLIRDHFPENPQWSLLTTPPAIPEFQKTPFKAKAYVKYGIKTIYPKEGVIKTLVGDTVTIELEVADTRKIRMIAPNTPGDSVLAPLPAIIRLTPSWEAKNKVLYKYVVENANANWVHILLNDDVVLQYKLEIRAREPLISMKE